MYKGIPMMGRDPDGKAKIINVDENGNVKVQQSGTNVLLSGEKVVADTATPEALAADTACRSVTVQAKKTNTKSLFIGNNSAQKIELDPGESIALAVANLNQVYVAVQVNGEGVNYVGVD